jgi:hypothetical protein
MDCRSTCRRDAGQAKLFDAARSILADHRVGDIENVGSILGASVRVGTRHSEKLSLMGWPLRGSQTECSCSPMPTPMTTAPAIRLVAAC